MTDGCRHKESREKSRRERDKDNVLKDKSEEKAAERNGSEGGRRKAEARRWSESRDRQKRNNSFSLTVSSEIHKRTAKYNSEIQHSGKLFAFTAGEEWRRENTDWKRLSLSWLHTETHCFLMDTVN